MAIFKTKFFHLHSESLHCKPKQFSHDSTKTPRTYTGVKTILQTLKLSYLLKEISLFTKSYRI